jgi:predicted Zn-dependent protease
MLILNNFAWSQIQMPSFDKKIVLEAAKRAYALSNGNLQILDTYIMALLKSDEYKECIALLNKNTAVEKEPRLQCHLALAFEKTGDLNRAVRMYQSALQTTATLKGNMMPVDSDKVKEHLNTLLKQD